MKSIRTFVYRFKYHYGRCLPLRSPVDISLELSSNCNMKCSYCYHADPDPPFAKNFMTSPIAMKIIQSAADCGVNSIKFNWRGEPTMNKNFRYITQYAQGFARGSTFLDRLVNSNFKFPLSRQSDILHGLCNLTKVKVSMDSFHKDVFDKQRAGGIHELTLKNIDAFYNFKHRKNTQIVIQSVRTLLNKDEDLEHKIKKRWPEAEASVRDMVQGRVEKDLSDYTHKIRHFHKERQSCRQAHVRLIFKHNGEAFPCCPDIKEQLRLGDIQTHSVKQIFNSYPARFLRKDLMTKKAFKKNPCANCSSFETFKNYKPVWGS